jgi:hypothetical protein
MQKTGEEELKMLTSIIDGLPEAFKETRKNGLVVNVTFIENIIASTDLVIKNLEESPIQYPEYSQRIEKFNDLKKRLIEFKSKQDRISLINRIFRGDLSFLNNIFQ